MEDKLILYNYSHVFHEFVYESEALKDPMVEGRFLIPALATDIKPPRTGNNKVACFNETTNQWEIKPDYRGVEVTANDGSGRTMVIVNVGDTPDDVIFEPLELTWEQRRQIAYPPIGDQLDEIMKWLATETEFQVPEKLKSIAMKCMSVKAHIPKEE